MESLGLEFRSVTLDQRGRGRSTRAPRDVSREAFADDVAAVIRAAKAKTPVVLVGQSMGAHTAFITAARHPGVVETLVMVEGDIGGGGEPKCFSCMTRSPAGRPALTSTNRERLLRRRHHAGASLGERVRASGRRVVAKIRPGRH